MELKLGIVKVETGNGCHTGEVVVRDVYLRHARLAVRHLGERNGRNNRRLKWTVFVIVARGEKLAVGVAGEEAVCSCAH